jgi:acetyl esterase/lipase
LQLLAPIQEKRMNRRALAGALPLAAALCACAVDRDRPMGAAPLRADVEFELTRAVRYTPADWPQALYADVYRPRLSSPQPAVLMIHGGGWARGERAQMDRVAERVARRGYVVVNADYRLAPGARFPAPLQDLQQALRWMRAHAAELGLDGQRIAAWGYSAGAHLAALLGGLSPGDRLYDPQATVAAVVAGGTPADLRKFHGGTLVPQFLGERWHPDSVVFREASPAAYVTPGDPPVFLYHGGWDRLVPVDQATDYKAALDAAGVPCELYLLRGAGHVMMFLFDRGAVRRGADFLDFWLRRATRERAQT